MNNENGEQEFDPFEEDKDVKTPRKRGGAVAWLALILALAAAGFTAYQWWLDRLDDPETVDRQAILQGVQRTQASLGQTVQALENRLSQAEQNDESGEISSLNSQFDSLQSRVAELGLEAAGNQALFDAIQTAQLTLEQRLAASENSIAALAARGDSPGKRMDLSEIEYLLRLASERLALFGDPRHADQALAMADERLETLDDPLYLPVRQRISKSRQALAEIPVPDTLQLSGRIAAMQAAIPALPFPGEMPSEPVAEKEAETGLWARFKSTMAGLVTVRRKVPGTDAVLSLEDKDYVRQGLWLQFESARLALMRQDSETYDRSLQRARDTLASRFEQRADRVSGVLSEIESLRKVELQTEMPDISAPWAQLRLLREGRAEFVTPVPAEPVSKPDSRAEDSETPEDAESIDAAGGEQPAVEEDDAGDSPE